MRHEIQVESGRARICIFFIERRLKITGRDPLVAFGVARNADALDARLLEDAGFEQLHRALERAGRALRTGDQQDFFDACVPGERSNVFA